MFAVCGTIEEKKEDLMETKTRVIRTRVSEEEYELIKRRAAEKHLTVSSYIRMLLMEGGKDRD